MTVGATDIGALWSYYQPGLDSLTRYRTAADVWLRVLHGIKQPSSKPMERGLRVEPLLREKYREVVGPCGDAPGTLPHPSLPWAVASPDAFRGDGPGGGLVEFKSASSWSRSGWGAPGTDHVKEAYLPQLAWQMCVTGAPTVDLFVGFGDGEGEDFVLTDFALYHVKRDPELEAALVVAGQRFYDEHLSTGTPPRVGPVANKREFKRLVKLWEQTQAQSEHNSIHREDSA